MLRDEGAEGHYTSETLREPRIYEPVVNPAALARRTPNRMICFPVGKISADSGNPRDCGNDHRSLVAGCNTVTYCCNSHPLIMGFDKTNFRKFMNERTAYQYQAMELIKICRRFSVTMEQTPDQHNKLQSVLEACDRALDYVTHPKKKGRKLKTTDQPTDLEIEKAIKKLEEYEYRKKSRAENDLGKTPMPLIVVTEMKAAKKKDGEKRKKDRIRVTDKDGERRVVDFHVFRSLSEKNPTIVTQELSIRSGVPDILWYFSHYRDEKRLTLAQSPEFYEGPPAFPTTFGPTSEIRPAEDYQGTIYVLTRNERQVFFRLNSHEKNRIFVSVWRMDDDTLIFKDVLGNIKGEDIVRKDIPDLPFGWSSQELPGSSHSSGLSEDDIPTGIPSSCHKFLKGCEPTSDWRAPIHDLWSTPLTYVHMRIEPYRPPGSPPSSRGPRLPPPHSFDLRLPTSSRFVTNAENDAIRNG